MFEGKSPLGRCHTCDERHLATEVAHALSVLPIVRTALQTEFIVEKVHGGGAERHMHPHVNPATAAWCE